MDDAGDVIDLMTTKQRRALLDRAASRRHHSSREVSPWHPEDDLQPPEGLDEVPAADPQPETLPLFSAAATPTWDSDRAVDLIAALYRRCGEACEGVPEPWPELDEEAIEAACEAHDLAALEAALAASEAGFRAEMGKGVVK